MADYSGDYYPTDTKTLYNQKIHMPLTFDDLKQAVREVLDELKEDTADLSEEVAQGDDVYEKSDGDPRSDYTKGYDAGWTEGYNAAKYEATVQAVKAIGEL